MSWLDKALKNAGQPARASENPRSREIRALIKAWLAHQEGGWASSSPEEAEDQAKLLALPPKDLIAVIKLTLEAHLEVRGELTLTDYTRLEVSEKLVTQIARRSLPLDAQDVREILSLYREVLLHLESLRYHRGLPGMMVRAAEAGGWPAEVRSALQALLEVMPKVAGEPTMAYERKMMKEVEFAIAKGSGDPVRAMGIERDAWGEQAMAALSAMDAKQRARLQPVLEYCASAKGTAPSEKWLKAGTKALEPFGSDKFAALACDWLRMMRGSVPKDPEAQRDFVLSEGNADLLKGMAWLLAELPAEAAASALGDAALAAFRKVPSAGGRSVKLGNACVHALKMLPGLLGAQQLVLLRGAVRQASYRAAVEEALAECAKRLNLSVADMEELATPGHGFVDGRLTVAFGAAAAELALDRTSVGVAWRNAQGKQPKSEPAEIKRDFPEQRKALKRLVEDVDKTIGGVRDRLERAPMALREWPLEAWRQRYFDHPVAGALARRLIWRFRGAGEQAGLWADGRWIDESGAPLEIAGATTVLPWHPVAASASAESVRAWRALLARHSMVQPFKQAHREIYLLTDAERTTGTYSNRFAAHVLRQHQFASLCAARGWRFQLQGMSFENSGIATLALAEWNLRAEFWVDASTEDVAPSGAFLHLLTDQVRFSREEEAVPLAEIPPLVLSEVLRDVDLFVGVTSIGADPTWADNGGRHQEYWQSYSFGELSVAAQGRKEVIGELLPRLSALRGIAEIDGRFLVVQGRKRQYKIHLGSGNILMLPNDQYLCIVPDRSTKPDPELRLPFEGDSALAVILSKAFLLARDDQIKDPTIVRQIEA